MKIKFGDILLSILIVFAAVILLLSFNTSDDKSLTAIIIKDNKEIKRINLSELSSLEIIEFDDNTDIEIHAENGRIRFVESSCLDKTCINTGWLTRAGDIAACLPNRVLIKIIGDTEVDDVDIIAQ